MSYQKNVIYGKKSVTRPPLHITLCYNSRWNGPISNFFSFWATERLFFISKWGRISPESDCCWFKLVLGSSSLLFRGYMDLSPAVGHVRLYQNGVEFRQKGIGAGLNLFWGHLNYPLGAFISKSQSPEGWSMVKSQSPDPPFICPATQPPTPTHPWKFIWGLTWTNWKPTYNV